MTEINQTAIIGGGVIGGGWAARLIENGIDVVVFDPAADAKDKFDAVLANAERAYTRLITTTRPRKGSVRWYDTATEASRDARLIIESVPERADIKRAVYAEIESTAAADAVITSSTSGIMPTELQRDMQHPQRLIVAHPFNPVYLLPLVELVGGEKTDSKYIDWAKTFYAEIGMHPLHCRVEIEGFISDRLQEAL